MTQQPLQWVGGLTYRCAARTVDGSYQVLQTAGGSRGPLYRAELLLGIGIAHPLGQPRESLDEAKADAQQHADEIATQNAAAAKDPTA